MKSWKPRLIILTKYLQTKMVNCGRYKHCGTVTQRDGSSFYLLCTLVMKKYRVVKIKFIRDPGGDFRAFTGEVPPWPETHIAKQLGQSLADRRKVPFYFPSPTWPEDDCASWEQRDRSTPCPVCGIPLVQTPNTPWRGMCYHCYMESKR
jgi:hypothetical protein